MKSASETDVLNPRQCATVLKALADETRLRILESLLVEEKCVSDIVRELGCPQPHVSHHLGILRSSGVVEGVREGKQVCYRITPVMQRALAGRRGRPSILAVANYDFPNQYWPQLRLVACR
ncbi:MAG: metalloregulator ArsR/SmtB family transcription factor [Nitrospira sp.]|nr:metalloregulator ArsR/SmtB family transcription factor [Nitrospira sp.]